MFDHQSGRLYNTIIPSHTATHTQHHPDLIPVCARRHSLTADTHTGWQRPVGVRAAVNNCVYRWYMYDLWVEKESERLRHRRGWSSIQTEPLSLSLCLHHFFIARFNTFTSAALIGTSVNEALRARAEQWEKTYQECLFLMNRLAPNRRWIKNFIKTRALGMKHQVSAVLHDAAAVELLKTQTHFFVCIFMSLQNLNFICIINMSLCMDGWCFLKNIYMRPSYTCRADADGPG